MTRLEEMTREHEVRMASDPAYRERLEQIEKATAQRKAMEAESRAEARRVKIGIPRFTWKILDAKPENTEPMRLVRRLYNEDELRILILAGPPGTGKTVAAAAYLDKPQTRRVWNSMRYDDSGAGAFDWVPMSERFVSASELPRHGIYGDDAEFWDDLKSVDRLVIDDLGTEPLDSKGFTLGNLADVVSTRHAELRKTAITTNLSLDAFRERYLAHDGGRLHDRLREAGVFYECAGASMRRPLEASHA
jgi:DNA replication protein DnaC